MDYSIFLFILNLILIIMIVGLIFMLQLFVPRLQKWVLSAVMLIAVPDRNIKFVVEKNLDGHARRNQKTSIMFMIALSFIIFAGCTLELVGNFVESASKNFFGADIWINQNGRFDTLDQNKLTQYLTTFDKKFPNTLKNYSFISKPLDEIIDRKISFSPLSGFPDKTVNLIGVDENIIDSGFSELYMVKDYDKNLKYKYNEEIKKDDIISGLFLNQNLTKKILSKKDKRVIFPVKANYTDNLYDKDLLIIIAEGMREKYSVDLDNPAMLSIDQYNGGPKGLPSKLVAVAIKIPGIPPYSSYYTIAQFSPIIMSVKQMSELIKNLMENDMEINNKVIGSTAYTQTPDYVPKKTILIKFYDSVPKTTKESVYYEIKNLINSDNTMAVFIQDIVESAQYASGIMELFFIIVGLIALILSFFLIWTSFYCNIKDNICEYGIMRAIGINQKQSMRVYLYEAAVLIISAIIVGTVIGVVTSTTLVLQFNLFSELPFNSNFPYRLYFIMCISGFVLGLLGSYYPTYQVNKLSLVKILKGIFD